MWRMLTLVASVVAQAGAERPYTMDDLRALEKQEGWAELVEHLTDVAPAQRDGRWEQLAEKAALAHLVDLTPTRTDPFGVAVAGDQLARRLPSVRRSRAFQERRSAAVLSGFDLCNDRQKQDPTLECLRQLHELVDASKDPGLPMEAGRRAVRVYFPYHAVPFYREAVVARPTAAACSDEGLVRATIAALGLPADYSLVADAKQVAFQACPEQLRGPLLAELKSHPGAVNGNVCPWLKSQGAVPEGCGEQ